MNIITLKEQYTMYVRNRVVPQKREISIKEISKKIKNAQK